MSDCLSEVTELSSARSLWVDRYNVTGIIKTWTCFILTVQVVSKDYREETSRRTIPGFNWKRLFPFLLNMNTCMYTRYRTSRFYIRIYIGNDNPCSRRNVFLLIIARA